MITDRVQLSQTMLGDNPEKSRNPLKKAMRRRNAKTVQFAEPTYYEPSDNDYTTDEENEDEQDFLTVAASARSDPQTDEQAQEQTDVVEPLKVRGITKPDGTKDDENIEAVEQQSVDANKDDGLKTRTIGLDQQSKWTRFFSIHSVMLTTP